MKFFILQLSTIFLVLVDIVYASEICIFQDNKSTTNVCPEVVARHRTCAVINEEEYIKGNERYGRCMKAAEEYASRRVSASWDKNRKSCIAGPKYERKTRAKVSYVWYSLKPRKNKIPGFWIRVVIQPNCNPRTRKGISVVQVNDLPSQLNTEFYHSGWDDLDDQDDQDDQDNQDYQDDEESASDDPPINFFEKGVTGKYVPRERTNRLGLWKRKWKLKRQ